MNNINLLSHRIKKIYGRLSELYRSAATSSSPSPELLPNTLMGLGVVSEALQLVMNELTQQNERLSFAQNKIEAESQRYQTLCEFLPDGYLVTDKALIIQEANQAASKLFNVHHQLLIGKSLVSLIANDDRQALQAKISQIEQRHRVELSIRLQRHQSDLFYADVVASVLLDQRTNLHKFQWLLRDATDRKRAESALECTTYNPCKDRPIHCYNKGEIIPLEPYKIWLVSKGVVKLTTMSDRGQEMLIGLAQDSMIFGSSLTALQTYEATALSKVQLVSIPLSEVSQSPRLVQFLLPLISQRLRQTESFLSIYGQLYVEDRLYRLLELLKQEIGQPIEDGVRLRIRLTHQDFAGACCTTRVTITRLLGKLQQEGKIEFDSHTHLVLKD